MHKTEYGKLNEFYKEFIKNHCSEINLVKYRTITPKQRNSIKQILNEKYPHINYNSLLSKLRQEGYAKPQERNR